MKTRDKYVAEIERHLLYVERGLCPDHYLSLAIDKLCWCKKFHKISEEDFDRLSDVIINIQENKPIY